MRNPVGLQKSRKRTSRGKKWSSYLLGFAFVRPLILVINARKVGNDDRNRKCDDQHTGQWANAAHYFAGNRAWHHVAVSANQKTRFCRIKFFWFNLIRSTDWNIVLFFISFFRLSLSLAVIHHLCVCVRVCVCLLQSGCDSSKTVLFRQNNWTNFWPWILSWSAAEKSTSPSRGRRLPRLPFFILFLVSITCDGTWNSVLDAKDRQKRGEKETSTSGRCHVYVHKSDCATEREKGGEKGWRQS